MSKHSLQHAVFGVIMSYTMAYGMEVYNVALQKGYQLQPGGLSGLGYEVFLTALAEAAYMGLVVLLVSQLWGNRLGAAFAARHCDPERDNPYLCRILRQAGTVAVMCPSMSLVASIWFSLILAHQPVTVLPATWVGTLLKNFPMAFFWNFFAAAPLTHWLTGKLVPSAKATS